MRHNLLLRSYVESNQCCTLRKTLRRSGHRRLISVLVTTRETAQLTQRDLAHLLKRPHSFVGRVANGSRGRRRRASSRSRRRTASPHRPEYPQAALVCSGSESL